MASDNRDTEPLAAGLLQHPLRARLPDDEQIQQVLTNRNIGVVRRADDTTEIEPADDHGAVAAVTDTGITFLVGDPADCDGDFVATVSLDAIASVATETEMLTQSLVVETTDGEEWAFTAREASTVDAAVDALESRLAERALAVADDHHEQAKAADDPADCAEQLEAALDAYRSAAELLGDDSGRVTDAERKAREDAEAVIATLISTYREHGAESRSAAEWELAADNDESAYELYVTAREAYDRALEIARAYPPGDPETIERERAEVVEAVEPLEIRFAVAEAADD